MLLFSLLLWIALGPSWADSLQLQSRVVPLNQFVDGDPNSPVTNWQSQVTQAFNDARALAERALNVPDGSPHFNLYFWNDDYRETIREIYRRIIAFIDNPPPSFRIRRLPSRGNGALAAAQRGEPDTLRVFADLFQGDPTFQNIPIMNRPSMNEVDREVAQQGPSILHELTHIVTQAPDFPWPTLPDNFLNHYRTTFATTGQNPQDVRLMVDDIRPSSFQDSFFDLLLLQEVPYPNDAAYGFDSYTTMRRLSLGPQMVLFNAQNYAAFAVAAMRNGNPVTGMAMPEELTAWTGFSEFALNTTFNIGNVRAMHVTVEIWGAYNLIPDFISKPSRARRQSRMGAELHD